MSYSLNVHLEIMEGWLSRVPRNAVAEYRVRLHDILKDSGISVSNPFLLYYPGMPAYDNVRKRNASNSD